MGLRDHVLPTPRISELTNPFGSAGLQSLLVNTALLPFPTGPSHAPTCVSD